MAFLAVIAGFLLLMLILPTTDPAKNVTSEMQGQAEMACESELPLLPTTYVVNSVAETTGSLNANSIVNLVIFRKLDFVEIKIKSNGAGQTPYIVANNGITQGWPVDMQPGGYAKVGLSDEGNSNCMVIPAEHSSIKEALYSTPLPAGKCLSVSYSPTPTADHIVRYQVNSKSQYSLLGYYQLLDNKTSTVLAQLSTWENPERPEYGDSVNGASTFLESSEVCRAPRFRLLDRLISAKFARENPTPVVKKLNKIRR